MVRKLLPCLLLGYLLIFLAACSPVPDIPVQYDPNTLVFSGERAYEIEEQFVTTYTGRVSGTENSAFLANRHTGRFRGIGTPGRLGQSLSLDLFEHTADFPEFLKDGLGCILVDGGCLGVGRGRFRATDRWGKAHAGGCQQVKAAYGPENSD